MKGHSIFMYWRELVDVLVASLFFWGIIAWLRRGRAFLAFLGLAILAAVYLVAQQLELRLTAWIFQGFAAVVLVLIVVVFQDDLRRLLEQIGHWGLRRRKTLPRSTATDVLVRAADRLSQTRTGALIVLPGSEPLDRHLEGGIRLGGHISEPLVLSLFDSSSPGHDGAVLVAGDRVDRFAVHLPLSDDHAQLGEHGTRHAAALGLSERSDALSVVVSEEHGTVSIARDGKLIQLQRPQELTAILHEFLAGVDPERPEDRGLLRSAGAQWRSLALSVLLAGGLWLLLGPGSSVVEATRTARVVVENLPQGYEVETVVPTSVEVVLSGPRRQLFVAGTNRVWLRVDAFLAQLGRRTFQVTPANVEHPPGVRVVEVKPATIRLSVRAPEAAEKKP